MKSWRSVSIYYRDENKVMRKIDGAEVVVFEGEPIRIRFWKEGQGIKTLELE
tara:strand:+ start:285 stop:440 length:156 start_codon:yes stop_codon:yes gene_type:complete